jgi:hypothetical protein
MAKARDHKRKKRQVWPRARRGRVKAPSERVTAASASKKNPARKQASRLSRKALLSEALKSFDTINFDASNIVLDTRLLSFDGPLASTITAEPRMTPTVITLNPPVQFPLAALPGTVTAHAEYSDHGRADQSSTLNVNATASDGSFTINWGATVQGGRLVYDRQMVVKHIPSGQTRTYPFHATRGDIRGQNPDKAAVKARLGALEHQVIAYKESVPKWCQFGLDGLPVFGPPNGFGIMQLDNSPTPTARQIWDWKQNVDAGIAKYDSGAHTVGQHYKNIKNQHPTLPDLTVDQLKRATYQYYNSGNNGFYWIASADGKNWIKNPDAVFTSYGDDAVRIENLVKAGTPPPEWN